MTEKPPTGQPNPHEHIFATAETVDRFRTLAERIAAKWGKAMEKGKFLGGMLIPGNRKLRILYLPTSTDLVTLSFTEQLPKGKTQITRYRLERDGKVTKNMEISLVRGMDILLADMDALKGLDKDKEKWDPEGFQKELEERLRPTEERLEKSRRLQDEGKEMGVSVLTEAELRALNAELEKLL